jgi:hypothetical protein
MSFLSGVHFLAGSHCKLRPNTEGLGRCLRRFWAMLFAVHRGCQLHALARCSPLSFLSVSPLLATMGQGMDAKWRALILWARSSRIRTEVCIVVLGVYVCDYCVCGWVSGERGGGGGIHDVAGVDPPPPLMRAPDPIAYLSGLRHHSVTLS